MANDNNGYLKGSKWNPYSYDEYDEIYMSTNLIWYGGWVGSNNNVTYIDRSDPPLQTSITGNTGSLEHPFTLFQRQTIMNENPGFWPGGWSESSDGVKYYLTGAMFYDATNNIDEPLGSASYPCPIEVYSNMCKNGIWNGGYVTYGGPDDIYFVDRGELVNGNGAGCGCSSGNGASSGSGSGSGQGSGSGSGEGLGEVVLEVTPGEAVIGQSTNMTVNLVWDHVPRFNIHVKAETSPNVVYFIERNSISIVWNGHSTVHCTGNLSYERLLLASGNVQGEGEDEPIYYEGYVVTKIEHYSISIDTNISIA